METILLNAEEKMENTISSLETKFVNVRAGRANASMLDGISVEYYGTPTPLKQLANISVPEARVIQIQPWESKMIKEIEKAILENRLYGINATKVLAGNGEIDEKEFYMMFAGLSYIGDTRMGIAENPDKVKNIVLGRLDFYEEVYGSKLGVKEGKIYIKEEDYLLPDSLTKFISNYKGEKAQAIRQFLTEKNKNHSLAQTIKGIFTTGPVKAIKYALAKLKRKKGK